MILKLASRPILLAGEEIQKLAHIHSVLYPNVKQLLRGTFRATTDTDRQERGRISKDRASVRKQEAALAVPQGEESDLQLTLQFG